MLSPNETSGKVVVLAVFLALVAVCTPIHAQTVLWCEDWEGNWTQDWHAEGGVWQVGEPTSGPGSAYDSLKCAATVLGGNYPEPADARLIRHTTFVVPSAEENPRLRFWHWYNFNELDNGRVQIQVGSGDWTTISSTYSWTSSGVWTYPSIDLSAYADSTVRVSFYLYSRTNGASADVSSGWYIDDVCVVTGPLQFNNPEGFESGIGDWYVTRGTWQVGEHSSYEGIQCAGTRLSGNYSDNVTSRLVSPPFEVPSASQNPRLRFWHLYSFSELDYGEVQIKTESGSWETISPQYTWTSSGAWTSPAIDLTTFADSTVQVAFYFYSRTNGASADVSSGWFVDDIEVVTGAIVFNNPEGFESGIGDWYASRGTWEVGEHSSYSGTHCAGTKLSGNYHESVSSSLVSPPYRVPQAIENPRLRFWHWYSFSELDYGNVQIKTESGSWEVISPTYNWSGSGVWSSPSIDLTAYADSTVQFAFYFYSKINGASADVSTGWYLDEVEVVTGRYVFTMPEDFEGGIGDWFARRGTWEVGEATSGPGSCRGGLQCAATVLGGNYQEPVDSRLVSFPFLVPDVVANPYIGFWHWYSFSELDNGEVQIQIGDGAWETVSEVFTNQSGGWTFYWIDLAPYANLTARLGFDFRSRTNGASADVSSGWYIDDIESNVLPSLVPTFLQSYFAKTNSTGINIFWRLATAAETIVFEIYRESVSNGRIVELSPAGFSNDGLSFVYRDQTVEIGESYRYQVYVSDEDGRRMLFETEAVTASGSSSVKSALHQNTPNPFNPSTVIRYAVGKEGHVSLRIYDASGALVKTLYDGVKPVGHYEVAWDGRNETGDKVSTGVYFYRLRCEGFAQTRKMVLLK